MNRLLLSIAFVLCVFVSAAQEKYEFNHGPYLQELTPDGVTFVFTTSRKGVSWIELKADGQPSEQRHYAVHNGLRGAYDTFNAIRVNGLQADKTYSYRMVSKEIADFQPYQVTFGDSIVSPWYDFKTLNPVGTKCSVLALSDMHCDADKLERLLTLGGVQEADLVFYVGDMMSYYDHADLPFTSYIDRSVELFASRKPFVVVRGNHETRGNMAREYARFVPRRDGRFYGAYRVGEVMFVILDCGEDKPDDFWVYAGLVDFDGYRAEQARWFEKLIKTKEYRSAKWHVVMNHFPPVYEGKPDNPESHGIDDITAKFLPLYNRADIDLMINGHIHRYKYMPPSDTVRFPVVVNSTESVARIDIDGKTMRVKVSDVDNKVLLEKEYKR